MIISHTHKFIYIKNRKVGSTSTEKALQKICGPDDIITPDHIHESDSDVLKPGAQNFEGYFLPFRELIGARSLVDAARTFRDFLSRPKFYNHMRASSVRSRIPKKIWDSYYKFCVERNPWDKSISYFYWFNKNNPDAELNTFYRNYRKHGTLDQVFASDWSRYTYQNKIIVDEVIDFSNLSVGVCNALINAGVPADTVNKMIFPKEKSNIRKSDKYKIDAHTDELIRLVFRNEIANFRFCQNPEISLEAYGRDP